MAAKTIMQSRRWYTHLLLSCYAALVLAQISTASLQSYDSRNATRTIVQFIPISISSPIAFTAINYFANQHVTGVYFQVDNRQKYDVIIAEWDDQGHYSHIFHTTQPAPSTALAADATTLVSCSGQPAAEVWSCSSTIVSESPVHTTTTQASTDGEPAVTSTTSLLVAATTVASAVPITTSSFLQTITIIDSQLLEPITSMPSDTIIGSLTIGETITESRHSSTASIAPASASSSSTNRGTSGYCLERSLSLIPLMIGFGEGMVLVI